MRCGERLLLFDAGTGMRYLGNTLDEGAPLDADLFFTHTHFDHVCGLPFFKPFFQPQNRLRLWAGHLGDGMTLRRVLGEFMMAPLFPVPPEVFRARMEYRDFKAGDTLRAGRRVTCAPRRSTIPTARPAIASTTPASRSATSPTPSTCPARPTATSSRSIKGADLVIYDSMYTDEEYPTYVGWGHSTWQEGVRLCREAGAKRLVVFHHDPEHDDDMLDGIAARWRRRCPGRSWRSEGLSLEP